MLQVSLIKPNIFQIGGLDDKPCQNDNRINDYDTFNILVKSDNQPNNGSYVVAEICCSYIRLDTKSDDYESVYDMFRDELKYIKEKDKVSNYSIAINRILLSPDAKISDIKLMFDKIICIVCSVAKTYNSFSDGVSVIFNLNLMTDSNTDLIKALIPEYKDGDIKRKKVNGNIVLHKIEMK